MADQHNSNIPAVGNTIAADIPDIKENLEFHKDAFQRIFAAWSDSDNSAAVLSTTPGFNNGTHAISFPTNASAAAKFMLGNSSTVTWFYLNTAPPFWKALSTGADMVLAISGGAAAYNVNGGNPDSSAAWAISGLIADAHSHTGPSHVHGLGSHTHTGPSHTHTGPSHTHTGTTSLAGNWAQPTPGRAGDSGDSAPVDHNHTFTSDAGGTGATGAEGTGATGAASGNTDASGTAYTGAGSAQGITSSGAWRPKASVGKLFQLDTP